MDAMIPTSFQLAGMPFTVEYADLCQGNTPSREERYNSGRLLIDASTWVIPREQNYYRELTAYILLTMGEEELLRNEQFLGVFSKLLHQALWCIQQEKAAISCCTLHNESDLPSYWEYLLAYCEELSPDNDYELDQMSFLGDVEDDDGDQWLDGDEGLDDSSNEDSENTGDDYDNPDCDGYYARTSDLEPWTEIADCWQRSDNDGWYYGDDD